MKKLAGKLAIIASLPAIGKRSIIKELKKLSLVGSLSDKAEFFIDRAPKTGRPAFSY